MKRVRVKRINMNLLSLNAAVCIIKTGFGVPDPLGVRP